VQLSMHTFSSATLVAYPCNIYCKVPTSRIEGRW
jgi:hypothetical protein